MPRLHIVIASTRPGRLGHLVGDWLAQVARQHGGFEVELVDLRDAALPLYDEPRHPMLRQYEHEHTKAWSASVTAADAFVFVTPEYNFAPPPSLINALDHVYVEWNYKAAGIVSYGGVSGGLRAAQALKTLLTTLKIMPIPEGVGLPYFARSIEDDRFRPDPASDKAATTMLDELRRWTDALAPLRAAR